MRPVQVLTHVFLARPNQLDRRPDLHRDAHDLIDRIDFQLPAEGPADKLVVDDNLLRGQSGALRCDGLRAGRHLRANPHLADAVVHMDDAIHRLHRRMRQERHFVLGIHACGCLANGLRRIAVPHCDYAAGAGHRLAQIGLDAGIVDACVGAFVPADIECRQTAARRPHMVADDGYRVVQSDNLAHAGHRAGAAVVHRRGLAAQHRRGGRRGDQHARHANIDAIDGRAIHLVRLVQALDRRVADALELRRRLERHVARYGKPRRGGGKRAII
jgi:hypothetical protein